MSDQTQTLQTHSSFQVRYACLLGLAVFLVVATRVWWLNNFPDTWILPIQQAVSVSLDWLLKDASLGGLTFKDVTRVIASVLSLPFDLINGLLWEGFSVAGYDIPPLSWAVIIAASASLAWYVGGKRLLALTIVSLGYVLLFDYWESAMRTLASILMVVPVCYAIGTLLGIVAYRSRLLRHPIIVFLDFSQTVPVFAYLLPILFLFGFGPLSAMIATMIYAMPPMVRAAMLGLETVPPSIREAGIMSGATRRQLIWQIMLPSARPALLLGLNQVIMLSLNAVIIASLIGAGGLGYDVMRALKSLRVGQGLEAGLAIVLIAVLLDKFSKAFLSSSLRAQPFVGRSLGTVLALCAALQVLSLWTPFLSKFPDSLTVTTGPVWDQMLDYVIMNYYDVIESFKNALLLYVMLPAKAFVLWLPWSFVVVLVGTLGWRLAGWKLGATLAALTAFVALSGFWEQAMITVYLVGLSALFAFAIGFPLGVWASANNRVSHALAVVTDVLQTLPSFVYLIPVVMLFQAGDVPALIAVIAYALAPVIRYTDSGLRNVSHDLVEAATAIGCTPSQILLKVKLRAALPEILLGINQTIMLALSMLVITALVGTSDLGQEVYIGLSRTDTGRGFVAGICVALIAIICDRLIQAAAIKQKQRMGY